MIIYLPLENLEQRYTIMMNKAIEPFVDVSLYPDIEVGKIEKGQFLDINKTSIFKAKQLAMIGEMFKKGKVKNGDKFLIADIFFPGIEMIRYMAELQDIYIEVYGFNYAGRADKDDFVRKLTSWADYSEKGYHEICNKVFVGSDYHKRNVKKYFGINNIVKTGLIWDLNYVHNIYPGGDPKEDFVIFPHRIAPEKGIDEFLSYAKRTKKKIVVTSSGNKAKIKLPKNVVYEYNLSKKEYYEIMSRAKYYISFAHQETFGYTLQEAIYYGCNILVPNRACYPEMVPKKNLYNNIDEIDEKFKKNLVVPLSYTIKWDNNVKKVLKEML